MGAGLADIWAKNNPGRGNSSFLEAGAYLVCSRNSNGLVCLQENERDGERDEGRLERQQAVGPRGPLHAL